MGEAKRNLLPPLRDWLAASIEPSPEEAGRAPFEDLAAFAGELLKLKPDPQRKHELVSCRMMQAAMLALVETSCEAHRHGFGPDEVMMDQAHALGQALGYLLMSLDWKDDAPVRQLVKPFVLEFERGLKKAVDSCLEDAAAQRGSVDMGGGDG